MCMYQRSCDILGIYNHSFIANVYTISHFRMIGLIDVQIQFAYGVERVTLGYYRSSGTNNGKMQGLWYPIVGIKLQTGYFTEFTDYINHVLSRTTSHGYARKGWLAKSLFFYKEPTRRFDIGGFASQKYYKPLLRIGNTLRDLYETDNFHNVSRLTPAYFNDTLLSTTIYAGNTHTQQENYETLIHDIFVA